MSEWQGGERDRQGEETGGTQTAGGGGVTDTVVVVASGGPDRRSWGLLLAVGIVAIIFGILVLANIWGSVRLVAILAGLFLVFAGIAQLASLGGARRRGGRILSGVIALILGLALILWPEASVKTVAVIVGLAFLVWGIAMVVAALMDRGESWGVAAGFGGLLAIIGIIVMAWPGPTIAILMVLVGFSALLFGISAVAQALALRRA
jgi:uncharacterized membrane protein HdeD (DUF308 family)